MEVGLGEKISNSHCRHDVGCLNPCFSGSRSRRDFALAHASEWRVVLILVLVEVGLGDNSTMSNLLQKKLS